MPAPTKNLLNNWKVQKSYGREHLEPLDSPWFSFFPELRKLRVYVGFKVWNHLKPRASVLKKASFDATHCHQHWGKPSESSRRCPKICQTWSATAPWSVPVAVLAIGSRPWGFLEICLRSGFRRTFSASMQSSVPVRKMASGNRAYLSSIRCRSWKYRQILSATTPSSARVRKADNGSKPCRSSRPCPRWRPKRLLGRDMGTMLS